MEITQVVIPENLESLTVKQLANIVRKLGIRGWHEMRRVELVSVLKKTAKTARKSSKSNQPAISAKKTAVAQTGSSKPKKKIAENKAKPVIKKTVAKTTKVPQKSKTAIPQSKTAIPQKRAHSAPAALGKKTPAAVSVAPKKDAQVARHSKTAISSKQTLPEPGPTPKPKQAAAKPQPEAFRFFEDYDAPNSRKFGLNESLTRSRDLGGVYDGEHEDRLVLAARDSYWLHAFWELNIKLIERAKAAMGVDWHTAVPILRLSQILSDGISKQRRTHVRDVRLHGQVNHWYIDVLDPPACFFVEIGYVSMKGRFFPLASSNTVETLENRNVAGIGSSDIHRISAARGSEQVFPHRNSQRSTNNDQNEAFENRPKRSIPTPIMARFGDGVIERVKVELEVDVVIYGKTQPDVQLSIKNEPIRLQPDGRFSFRFPLPEKRQVYPIAAVSSDGIESQTTILAIERNTKSLETVFREHDEIE